MPSYEFRCQTCGHQFTVKIAWEKKSSVTCPECGGDKLREVFGSIFWSGGTNAAGAGGCGGFG